MSELESVMNLNLSKLIDHSLLNPTLSEEALARGIQLALTYDTGSGCILPYALQRCAALLQGSTVKVSATIGFRMVVRPSRQIA